MLNDTAVSVSYSRCTSVFVYDKYDVQYKHTTHMALMY